MVVAALSLERLDDDRRDVVLVLLEGGLHLRHGERLARLRVAEVLLVQREPHLGIHDARPGEFREVGGLPGIGGVGERERVAGAPVKGLLEVEHLVATLLAIAAHEVLAHLPVEGRLEGVLDAQGAAGHQEEMRKVLGHGVRPERLHELRHLDGVHIRVGGIVEGRPEELLRELRRLHPRVRARGRS